MTRIVLLANNIDELGGAQRIAHVLAEGFRARHYEVELIGFVPKQPVHDYGSRGRTLLDEPLAPKREVERRAAQRRQINQALEGLLASGPPGIVLTVQVWAMEHLLEVDHRGWRTIGQYHSSYQAAVASGDLHRLVAAYATADWFTPLTDEDARAFIRHGLNNAIAMPNPIHPWPEHAVPGDAKQITVLGRLSPEKGPDIAVAAWHRIADRFPDWQLHFVGDGPVAVTGPRVVTEPPTPEPFAVLERTGVLCLPSRVEGMPLALAEAMAAGLPVVAADCSAGVRQLVGDAGVLVPAEDPSALAAGLSTVLESAELRHQCGERARARMADYQLVRVMDRWDWLIGQTLR